MTRALPWILLVVFTASSVALGQDDDDLSPIAPTKKPAPKPAAKKPPAKKPPPAATRPKPADDDDDLAPIAVAKGDLIIKLPQGLSNAILSVDNKDVGPLPLGAQSLTAGEHQVKVRRLGYADYVKRVTITGGKPTELEVKLQAINAIVSVTSDVPDAQVFVNGRLVGTAPMTDMELPAGPTEIAVRKEGFKDDKQRVVLVAGKDYPIVVKFSPGATSTVVAAADRPVDTRLTPDEPTALTPAVAATVDESPIYGRWYFWAGVAAVAVGAAVVTGVVVSNNNQPPQRIDEKTVCAVNGGRCDICVGFQCSAAGLPSGVLNF
ncbi:MAG: PEGA domain-containing protein [Myxococcaceae bacterium]|nr:PEGA domain-containing protein [Myxococcaceae bacterium]